jgi:hypothetical protein
MNSKLLWRLKAVKVVVWILIIIELGFIVDHYRMKLPPLSIKASAVKIDTKSWYKRRKFHGSVKMYSLRIKLSEGTELRYSTSAENGERLIPFLKQSGTGTFLTPAIKLPFEPRLLIGFKTENGYSMDLYPAWTKGIDYRLFFPPFFIVICLWDIRLKKKQLAEISHSEAPQKIFN